MANAYATIISCKGKFCGFLNVTVFQLHVHTFFVKNLLTIGKNPYTCEK